MMVCTVVPALVNFGPVPDPGLQEAGSLPDDKTLVIIDLNLVYWEDCLETQAWKFMGNKGFCWIFRKVTSQGEGWDLRRQRIVVKYRGSLPPSLCIALGPRSRLEKPERNNVRNLSGRDEVWHWWPLGLGVA